MSKIRILIADDHALVRSGLRALLSAHPDMEVVGEADDGAAVEGLCRQLSPDVVLMDLTMRRRGGIAAAEDIRRTRPGTRVLILTMHEDEVFARQAALAGASGYVLKRSLASDLIEAIRGVHGGRRIVPPALAHAFNAPDPPLPSGGRTSKEPAERLSEREREVVHLVALGHTNSEIAGRLFISEKTVETHRAHILQKLGLRTRADIVRFAIEHGLMEP